MRTVFLPGSLPDAARQSCATPSTLPDRALSSREVASAWGRDRTNLRVCEGRRAAAVDAFDALKPVDAR